MGNVRYKPKKFAVIGAGLLWVGWFGFNAGSELMADGTAGLAFLLAVGLFTLLPGRIMHDVLLGR